MKFHKNPSNGNTVVPWKHFNSKNLVIRDLVGNNNNNIANCIFCLTKKSNQPEDGL